MKFYIAWLLTLIDGVNTENLSDSSINISFSLPQASRHQSSKLFYDGDKHLKDTTHTIDFHTVGSLLRSFHQGKLKIFFRRMTQLSWCDHLGPWKKKAGRTSWALHLTRGMHSLRAIKQGTNQLTYCYITQQRHLKAAHISKNLKISLIGKYFHGRR